MFGPTGIYLSAGTHDDDISGNSFVTNGISAANVSFHSGGN